MVTLIVAILVLLDGALRVTAPDAGSVPVSGGTAARREHVRAALATRPLFLPYVRGVRLVPPAALCNAAGCFTGWANTESGEIWLVDDIDLPAITPLIQHEAAHLYLWAACGPCSYHATANGAGYRGLDDLVDRCAQAGTIPPCPLPGRQR